MRLIKTAVIIAMVVNVLMFAVNAIQTKTAYADLDVDQQDKLEAEFAKEIHLMTAEPRLKSIEELWLQG